MRNAFKFVVFFVVDDDIVVVIVNGVSFSLLLADRLKASDYSLLCGIFQTENLPILPPEKVVVKRVESGRKWNGKKSLHRTLCQKRKKESSEREHTHTHIHTHAHAHARTLPTTAHTVAIKDKTRKMVDLRTSPVKDARKSKAKRGTHTYLHMGTTTQQ